MIWLGLFSVAVVDDWKTTFSTELVSHPLVHLPTKPFVDVSVCAVPQLPKVPLHHPLADAPSPLIRALPDCEASFQQHLMEARVFWESSQQRMHRCRQLLSEQEVQARAADAARANVESHYTYICNVYADFCDR